MTIFQGHVEVAESPNLLAELAAEWLTERAVAGGAPFRIALSGGSTPKPVYQLLASRHFASRFPWAKVQWFWGDERFVPHDHPDSNFRMANEAMLSRAPIPPDNIFPIPTDGEPGDAALRYEETLKR